MSLQCEKFITKRFNKIKRDCHEKGSRRNQHRRPIPVARILGQIDSSCPDTGPTPVSGPKSPQTQPQIDSSCPDTGFWALVALGRESNRSVHASAQEFRI